jgi:flagellar biosynthesis/type III secretory pathway chaperone
MSPMNEGSLAGADDRLDALRAEIAGFQALNEVLNAEADALRRADADALSVLSGAKLDQVNALQGFARQRSHQLKHAGLPETTAGVQAWLDASPDPAAAHAAWERLTALALAAKRQNDVNGRLAARQRWHFDAALGALVQAAGIAPLYDAQGRARDGVRTTALVRA